MQRVKSLFFLSSVNGFENNLGEKVQNFLLFLRLSGGYAAYKVLHKEFAKVKLLVCDFIVTPGQPSSKKLSMLLSVTTVLNFDASL